MGSEPNPHLRIQRADHRGSTVVVVEGEIDLATAPAVEKALGKAADEGISVVDLTGVTFIDSTGLRALLVANSNVEGRLSLIVAQGPVTRLFEITGVDLVFRVFATRDEALAST